MFCKNCGNEIKNDTRVCNVCGYELSNKEHKKLSNLIILLITLLIVRRIGCWHKYYRA